MEKQKNILIDLFITFAKIGLFTFGGGYAMISPIEDQCVEKKNWITHDDMLQLAVIAESTPGSIAINCATFVGYKQKGVLGSLSATLGVLLPSFVIIFLVSAFLDHFLEIKWVANAFQGIKAAVGILIVDVAVKMIVKMEKKILPLTIMIAAFLIMMVINFYALRISTIFLMLAAGGLGVAAYVMHGLFGEDYKR